MRAANALSGLPAAERAFSTNLNQRIWNPPTADVPRIMLEMKSRLLDPLTLVRDAPLGEMRRLAPAVTF